MEINILARRSPPFPLNQACPSYQAAGCVPLHDIILINFMQSRRKGDYSGPSSSVSVSVRFLVKNSSFKKRIPFQLVTSEKCGWTLLDFYLLKENDGVSFLTSRFPSLCFCFLPSSTASTEAAEGAERGPVSWVKHTGWQRLKRHGRRATELREKRTSLCCQAITPALGFSIPPNRTSCWFFQPQPVPTGVQTKATRD